MTSLSRLFLGIILVTPLAIGCSGGGDSTPGTGGSGGSTGTGGSGGGIPFMAVTPCSTESAYTTTGTTITFGSGSDAFNYAPKCLKVSKGATVTWNGDFATHPLAPSTMRGTLTGNPITATTSGTTASFTFPTSGFYAYLCNFHGADDGMFMDGVLWVN